MKVKDCGLKINSETLEINEQGELSVKAKEAGAAVADATDSTDSTDVITQLNALLASLRTAKIIKNS